MPTFCRQGNFRNFGTCDPEGKRTSRYIATVCHIALLDAIILDGKAKRLSVG